MKADLYIRHIGQLATCRPPDGKLPLKGSGMNQLEIIENGALACLAGEIILVGTTADVDRQIDLVNRAVVIDADDKVVTPGLIDPHTHPVFAKTREDEFEMRNMGKSYMEIAQAGGGIRNSTRALRETSKDALYDNAKKYLDLFLQYGTTTIEAKSGYGLTTQDEIKQLEVIQMLSENHALDLIPTFLGAHEIPDEYRDDKDAYVELIINEMIPVVAERNLAVFSDVFCEKGVFELEESERIQVAAKEHGLELKFHADEIVNLGGAQLAAKLGAVSADHLVYISEEGIAAMAEAGTMAVMLPGTSFYLDLRDYAPARRMIEAGVPLALSTDFNPGSSATVSLQMIMTLAGNKLKMSTNEIINAVTINSACALKQEKNIGSIEPGKKADIVVWNVSNLKQLPYFYAINQVEKTIKNGRVVYDSQGTK
ncbi:MAG TPA: imidazolonepropionase [candidate division Zixibacteria bacterium]|nr:imidazolonepropionase [candidate division Zixibacteria bacterium]HEQ99175.1 imidazolonepropionase [candidate division Zixibacteria bacterium]